MERKSLLGVAALLLLCSLNAAAQPDTMWTRVMWPGRITSIYPDPAGGLLCAGVGDPGDSGISTIFLMKLSEQGDSLWLHLFPDLVGDFWESDQYENGDILILSSGYDSTHNDRVIVSRISRLGQIEWSHDAPDSGGWSAVAALPDGGVILVGSHNHSGGDSDAQIARLDSAGQLEWRTEFGDSNHAESLSHVTISTTGEIAAVGATQANEPGWPQNALAAGMSLDGEILWVREYGDTLRDEGFVCGCASEQGGFLFGGYRDPFGSEAWIYRVNQDGDSVWSREYPSGQFIHHTFPSELVPSPFGGYVCVGTWELGQPWLLRIEDNGNELWQACCWSPPLNYHQTLAGMYLSDGGMMLGGRYYIENHQHVWLIRMSPDPTPADLTQHIPTNFALSNFPNPFNPTTEIEFILPRAMNTSLRVYDLLGREVATLADGNMNAGTHHISFDGSSLASGLYFCTLTTSEFATSRKMLLLK